MRIGIAPVFNSLIGGTYQYSATMVRTLYEWTENEGDDEFVVFADRVNHPLLKTLNRSRWRVESLEPPSLRRFVRDVCVRALGEQGLARTRSWIGRLAPRKTASKPDLDRVRSRPDMRQWFQQFGVELMVYPATYTLAFETGLPYVMAIHDLQHRLQPDFPEFSTEGFTSAHWEQWEYLFRNGARYATLLLADSEVGKEDILNFYGSYGVTPDRVKVLPFIPASYLAADVSNSERKRVQKTHRLPERYLFYPAQFWPHKNHSRIVKSLALLSNLHGSKIPIVFCGSHAGRLRDRTFREVMALSHQLGMKDQIHYLGYVSDEDMSVLYTGATALVMPTFFGPTNIPVVEAWALGCPVLTSDIRGIREHAGDAAVLVDPRSVESIAEGIYKLWTDESLRMLLAGRGRSRFADYSPAEFQRRLINILEEAKNRVSENSPKQ